MQRSAGGDGSGLTRRQGMSRTAAGRCGSAQRESESSVSCERLASRGLRWSSPSLRGKMCS